LVPAFLNDNPNVKPSAHLWHITAKDIPKHYGTYYSIPIANPSKNACIPNYMTCLPMATCKIYGVRLFSTIGNVFCFGVS
jgi:hypothetical protein